MTNIQMLLQGALLMFFVCRGLAQPNAAILWQRSAHSAAKSRMNVTTATKSTSDQLVKMAWAQHQTIFVTCLFVMCAVVIKIVYKLSRRISHLVPESV